LRDHDDELESLRVGITLITFGTPEQARRWLKETAAPFPMLLDPDRSAYRTYGLERSKTKVLHPAVFATYFRLLLKGRKLRPVQGDPYQLGGDFLIDRNGIVRIARPSDNPADRPSIQEIFQALKIDKQTTSRNVQR
jgi:peroxiredoxin